MIILLFGLNLHTFLPKIAVCFIFYLILVYGSIIHYNRIMFKKASSFPNYSVFYDLVQLVLRYTSGEYAESGKGSNYDGEAEVLSSIDYRSDVCPTCGKVQCTSS